MKEGVSYAAGMCVEEVEPDWEGLPHTGAVKAEEMGLGWRKERRSQPLQCSVAVTTNQRHLEQQSKWIQTLTFTPR